MVSRLASLLDTEPHHENTYILIGNYLIDHPDCCVYFTLKLLGLSEIGRKKANYKWVLILILLNHDNIDEAELKEFDYTIADIIEAAENEEELRHGLELLKFILGLENSDKSIKYLPK